MLKIKEVRIMQQEIIGSKNYIIPMDPETRDDLLSIDRATKEDLRERHRLYLDNDWTCNTIANTVIESLNRRKSFL